MQNNLEEYRKHYAELRRILSVLNRFSLPNAKARCFTEMNASRLRLKNEIERVYLGIYGKPYER